MAAILRRAQPFLHPITRENAVKSLREHGVMSKAYISTATQGFSTDGRSSDRVFANYNIYKGKAALSASPRLPQFSKLDSGSLKVDRQGTIMLSFSPAIGERKYDWEKKQIWCECGRGYCGNIFIKKKKYWCCVVKLFALSPTEIGSLISLGPDEACEFFHDPSMKSSNAGQVRKTLQVKPHADGSGYFISLSVVNNVQKISERVTVPVTKAEFAVMRTAFSFALPHIMGWDRYVNQPPQSIEANAPMVDTRVKSLEWDR